MGEDVTIISHLLLSLELFARFSFSPASPHTVCARNTCKQTQNTSTTHATLPSSSSTEDYCSVSHVNIQTQILLINLGQKNSNPLKSVLVAGPQLLHLNSSCGSKQRGGLSGHTMDTLVSC